VSVPGFGVAAYPQPKTNVADGPPVGRIRLTEDAVLIAKKDNRHAVSTSSIFVLLPKIEPATLAAGSAGGLNPLEQSPDGESDGCKPYDGASDLEGAWA